MELGLEPRSAPKRTSKGSGSSPEVLRTHTHPPGAAPGRGVPTTCLLLRPCILVFQCPWRGVVAAAAPAPHPRSCPLHGSSAAEVASACKGHQTTRLHCSSTPDAAVAEREALRLGSHPGYKASVAFTLVSRLLP